MKLLLLLSLFYPFSLFGSSLDLSKEQLKVLHTVREIAKSIPDSQGQTYEDTMSAICLTESNAGKDCIDKSHKKNSLVKSSFGVMQIKVQTSRHIAKQVKELKWILSLSDAQIATHLIKDPKFSARIATYYFVMLQNKRENYIHAVGGYNGGMSNPAYYKRVMQNLLKIKQLSKEKKLS